MVCPIDQKPFEVKAYRLKTGTELTCSRSCANTLKFTGKEKRKWGKARWFWVDRPNEYRNLHKKLYKLYGKPDKCEHCKQQKSKYYWSNRTGKYLIDREDWLMLCASCHWKYDFSRAA